MLHCNYIKILCVSLFKTVSRGAIINNNTATQEPPIVSETVLPPGPEPSDLLNRTISLIPAVPADNTPFGSSFGDVLEQPSEVVNAGDTVRVAFVGANPRNDLRQESGYVAIEKLDQGNWITVATDADWDTRFYWERVEGLLSSSSRVTITWRASSDRSLHRVSYHGAARGFWGSIRSFRGVSNPFMII